MENTSVMIETAITLKNFQEMDFITYHTFKSKVI